jgi:hypothetical protein
MRIVNVAIMVQEHTKIFVCADEELASTARAFGEI